MTHDNVPLKAVGCQVIVEEGSRRQKRDRRQSGDMGVNGDTPAPSCSGIQGGSLFSLHAASLPGIAFVWIYRNCIIWLATTAEYQKKLRHIQEEE